MNDTDTAVDVSVGDICKYPPKVPGKYEERIFMILEISPTFSWVKVLVLVGDVAGVYPHNFMPGSAVTIYGAIPHLKKI